MRHKFSITKKENSRLNALSVVQLGEAMMRDGTVKRGTLDYTQVLHTVADAKRTLENLEGKLYID